MNNNEEMKLLREKLSEEISLPESLSPENIEKLVSGEKQEKSPKGNIRRFAAVAVAACIMITSIVFLWDKDIIPDTTSDTTEGTTEISAENSGSYDELIGKIKKYAEEYESKVILRGENYFYGLTDDLADSEDVALGGLKAEESMNSYNTGIAASPSHGTVNLRDGNVNEADILITDGEYFYSVTGYGKFINIIEALPDGTMKTVWTKEAEDVVSENKAPEEIAGYDVHYHELYKYESYLLVGFTKYNFPEGNKGNCVSGVLIFDITDKSAPVLVREFAVDGFFMSSRITDGKLVLISKYQALTQYFSGKDDSVLIPTVYNNGETVYVPCDCICFPPEEAPETYINISKIDLSDINGEAVTSSILGKAYDMYCTRDSLYLWGTKLTDSYWGFGRMFALTYDTVLTKIDISGDKATFICSAELDGNILNSFAIDEYNGYIRIALQREEDNSILILNEKLEKVSEITGIAKGERIKSSRFMGNTAYVVTFVQTDPLFVIDLSDPEKPVVLGEVKLPGFSSYLHPVGDGLLVGIGQGGTETGVDGSSKISLFDVSDPASPKEIDYLSFPDSYLRPEYKAFCSVTENSFLVTYQHFSIDESKFIDTEDYRGYYFTTGALYFAVENGKLVQKGSYLAESIDAVERATFINDKVYIFGSGFSGITSFDMKTSQFIDTLSFGNFRMRPVS